ncbi:MAG: hypothetical protein OXL40_05820 [Bacteroidota bacterium]|nr:hypothetical protein [Bacteroidota bacterium]
MNISAANYLRFSPPIPVNVSVHHTNDSRHDLVLRDTGGVDRLSLALFGAPVDPVSNQIDAAVFTLPLPLFKSIFQSFVIGLSKTIETEVVLFRSMDECQLRIFTMYPPGSINT